MRWLAVAWIACDGGGGGADAPAPDACDELAGEAFCDGAVAVTCDAAGDIAERVTCEAGAERCELGACLSCAVDVEVPGSDRGAITGLGITVEIDPAPFSLQRLPRARAIVVTGHGVPSVQGPFALWRADGTALAAGDVVGDETVLLTASGPGEGAFTIEVVAPCEGETSSFALTAVEPVPLVGQALSGFPWFDVDHALVPEDGHLDLLVPAEVYFDRTASFDAVLVRHRTPAEWALDPTLTDGVLVPAELGAEASFDALVGGPDLVEPWDVVIDFGRDGRLDPGDLLDGLDAPAIQVVADLSEPGPFTPSSGEVSGGYWLTGVLYAPAEVEQLDPMPLVVISHGNGHDFSWYDWLGNHLASYGYVVYSHRNDTVPGPVTAAETTWENTEWLLGNLGTLGGGMLDGEVDADQIAWIGHSRGGEGVVLAYADLAAGRISPTNYDADDVKLVSSIAPTLFQTPDDADPHDTTYHLIAGSADGDVTGGVDNPIVQYHRIFQRATGLRAVTYLQGASHNDFNCCGLDDAMWVPAQERGPLIGREATQQAARGYYLALLEAVFRGRTELYELQARPPELFRPPGTDVIVASQLIRADGDRKLVIDDFQANPDPTISSSGGAVTATVLDLVEGALDDRDSVLTPTASDPANGMTQADDDPDPARGVVFAWGDGDEVSLEFELPAGERDLTDDTFVSLRACQMTRAPETVALDGMLSFSIALVDGQGDVSAIDHRVYGGIPEPYSRGGSGLGRGWSNEFQTIRVPIAAFARDGREVDLADVRAIRLLFGAAHGSAQGRVGLDDVEILAEASP